MAKVKRCSVRMYRVGFGDCFLLSLGYAGDRERHVLVDFGRTHAEANVASEAEVGADIVERCGQDEVVLVATHRHKDHVSGYDKAWESISKLKVVMVAQPWTEQPDLPGDAEAPFDADLDDKTHRLQLRRMQRASGELLTLAKSFGRDAPSSFREEIEFLADDNLGNEAAVRNLASYGERCRYLKYGDGKAFEDVLPGVRTHVLGPPTIEQWGDIKKQRSRDTEYWHLRGFAAAALDAAADATAAKPPLAERAKERPPSAHTAWFRRRVRAAAAGEMLGIVRALDKSMNNTSLILAFEIGDQVLLFPGDAQIENWSFALAQDGVRELLAKTTFYKVGHHGSLNATPISMWEGFEHRGEDRHLVTALSTQKGVHGSRDRQTEVPRSRLVRALNAGSTLHRTDEGKSRLYDDILLFDDA